MRDIAACRLPEREARTTPRVVKRKMSNFKLKRGSPPPSSRHLDAFAATVHILPQDLPAQQTLDRPQPGDEPLDLPSVALILI